MKILPSGLTVEDILTWVDQSDSDARNWFLKPGAPERVAKAFPQYIETYLLDDEMTLNIDPRDVEATEAALLRNSSLQPLLEIWRDSFLLILEAQQLSSKAQADLSEEWAKQLEEQQLALEKLQERIRQHFILLVEETNQSAS